MGLLDKVKNLFTEEVEIEEKQKKKIKEEPIQKEVIQVEIPSPEKTVDAKKEPIEKVEEEYRFPFFDDDDFDTIEVKPKEKKEKKQVKKEIYNPPREEKKVFKPSPIISPVFGFLDKDYQKEELTKAKKEYSSKRATVDEIRDKAYGSLESDIETTLFGGGRVLFDDKEEAKELDKIEKSQEEDDFDSKVIGEKPRHEKNKEDDLTDLLEAEMAKAEKEEKPSKKKKPRKISDKELFNLIDSMYEGEIK